MRQFEEWCRLLLLDALQCAGFFRAAGQRAAAADIVRLNRRAAGAAGHARMVAAALDILLAAAFIRQCLSPACCIHSACYHPASNLSFEPVGVHCSQAGWGRGVGCDRACG